MTPAGALRPNLLLAAAGPLAVVVAGLAGAGADVFIALPVLICVVPLLLGRYVGEGRLQRLAVAYASRRSRPARARGAQRPVARRALAAMVPRGGALMAVSLAVRPPPGLLAATS